MGFPLKLAKLLKRQLQFQGQAASTAAIVDAINNAVTSVPMDLPSPQYAGVGGYMASMAEQSNTQVGVAGGRPMGAEVPNSEDWAETIGSGDGSEK